MVRVDGYRCVSSMSIQIYITSFNEISPREWTEIVFSLQHHSLQHHFYTSWKEMKDNKQVQGVPAMGFFIFSSSEKLTMKVNDWSLSNVYV